MKTFYSRNVFYIISTICCSLGVSSIEVATVMPKKVENILKKTNLSEVKDILNNSRRIVIGTEALNNRPYMVYLKLPTNNPKYKDYRRWLCGGVIIHDEYILTSAACIEDAKHFYIVSGTFRHDEADDRYSNPCIKNGAKKAIWKCIPRNYVFDGHENDNIRWMNNDIAIVRVEDEFDFTRRVRGCDFIPRPVCYNNQSAKLEEPDSTASIAGWGSTFRYNDNNNADAGKQNLLETNVIIIPKQQCKQRWGRRYHNIIENYMICTKDIVPDLSEICSEKYVDCTDVQYSDSEEGGTRRVLNPNQLVLHSAYHNASGRRQNIGSGGFCENDHGGPLVAGEGVNAMIIGIISACLVKENTNRCYGPFLYTSVYKNRALINCAVFKDAQSSCDKLFRSDVTHTETEISWADHPDGPAKNEITKVAEKKAEEIKRRQLALNESVATNWSTTIHPKLLDAAQEHSGVVVRSEDVANKTATTTPKANSTSR
ncbi:hypothetical protein B5X24_HaOG203894 [Helicoverpa armigera]|uniref:Peptidase S1 domain-containing protein n=1 Tax=Helicoverpa armigera TaxID=29058 RepID=A0A2W1BTR5_HELAM|nr:uncharacterized protein LOC110377128 [Helicoverpa armigera]PZC77024.1 hypothetical protein B5X24_HaOG203894 [Helicoverpa armigera]